ncbi:hypothetical protein SAMN04487820_112136 [Actinopolyspora mzabensis]|uniref:Uncharacterized protein n=1 Tax=Actinopolyspora mzabensis TaxID=995066 RepID=A0A1G9EM12_ACTMZ|nr:hypothetical protein SAMN04487820_112136 [Actinopolyspora mzabensis]
MPRGFGRLHRLASSLPAVRARPGDRSYRSRAGSCPSSPGTVSAQLVDTIVRYPPRPTSAGQPLRSSTVTAGQRIVSAALCCCRRSPALSSMSAEQETSPPLLIDALCGLIAHDQWMVISRLPGAGWGSLQHWQSWLGLGAHLSCATSRAVRVSWEVRSRTKSSVCLWHQHQVSDAATGSSDEPGPVPPKILGLEPGQSPDPDAVPAIAPSSTLTSGMLKSWQEAETPTRAERDGAKVAGCAPYTGADYPHRSSTGAAVSAHGWWKKGTCSNGTATVKACLYEYYTDGTWRRKACNTDGNLKPGGGSARRVPVRKNCPARRRPRGAFTSMSMSTGKSTTEGYAT